MSKKKEKRKEMVQCEWGHYGACVLSLLLYMSLKFKMFDSIKCIPYELNMPLLRTDVSAGH